MKRNATQNNFGFPIVIKADGLALGKGVIIAPDAKSAAIAITEMMEEGKFGEAGRRVVIEEFLRGWECSLHALVDGENYQMLATARDHKRAYDGDAGPNTGGMGAFSPAEEWSDKLQTQFDTEIMRPLLAGLRENGVSFRGLLFPGPDGDCRRRTRFRIQLPFRRSRNTSDSAAVEIRFVATARSDDRRAARQNENRLG